MSTCPSFSWRAMRRKATGIPSRATARRQRSRRGFGDRYKPRSRSSTAALVDKRTDGGARSQLARRVRRDAGALSSRDALPDCIRGSPWSRARRLPGGARTELLDLGSSANGGAGPVSASSATASGTGGGGKGGAMPNRAFVRRSWPMLESRSASRYPIIRLIRPAGDRRPARRVSAFVFNATGPGMPAGNSPTTTELTSFDPWHAWPPAARPAPHHVRQRRRRLERRRGGPSRSRASDRPGVRQR